MIHSNVLPEIQYKCGRSWPHNIFIHQKLDDGKYGKRFLVTLPPVSRNANMKILWIMVSLLSRSKLIWEIIDRKTLLLERRNGKDGYSVMLQML